jgi:hypothetical protein
VTATDVVCTVPLDEAAARHRESTHVLQRVGGKTVAVQTVNAAGRPTAGEDGVAGWTVTYQGDAIRERQAVSASGAPRARYVHDPDGTRVRLLDAEGRPWVSAEDGPYNVLVTERDERGFVTSLRYFDDAGRPAEDDEGVHERELALDDGGRIRGVVAWGPEGDPTAMADGSHARTYRRDARGFVVRIERRGTDGRPLRGAWMGAASERDNDAWGNRIASRELDERGTVLWQEKIERDDRGQIVRTAVTGADGKPIRGPLGYHASRRSYDRELRLSEMVRFDEGGEVAPPIVRLLHDGRHRVVERTLYDAMMRPRSPVASERLTYDERDNPIGHTFRGPDGELALGPSGVAGQRTTYDDRDRATETRHLDEKLRTHPGDGGCAIVRYSYDASPLRPELTCHAADGRKVEALVVDQIEIASDQAPAGPPHLPRSAADARARASEARALLAAGARFDDVAALYDDDTARNRSRPEARLVAAERATGRFGPLVAALAPGGVTAVIEDAGVFKLFVRVR